MARLTPPRALLAFGAVAVVFAPACSDEAIAPVPVPTVSVPPEPPPPPPPPPPPAKKRTVIERDPFGNVAETENLLWDGDFEWASPFSDQYGWIEPPASPVVTDVVVGPLCTSGIKCARLTKNEDLVGIAVGRAQGEVRASIEARFLPDEGEAMPACSEMEAFMLDLELIATQEPDVQLTATTELPDDAGICRLAAPPSQRLHKIYLYVRNRANVPAVVDNAVIAQITSAPQPFPGQAPKASLDPVWRTRAENAVRATRLPVDDKPNSVRDAFRAHKGKVSEP